MARFFGRWWVVALAALTLFDVVLAIISGLYTGVSSGDWHPFVESTAGTVFGADESLYQSVQPLADPGLVSISDPSYRSVFFDSLRSKARASFLVLLFMIYLVYRLVKSVVLSTTQISSLQNAFISFVVALVVVALAEVLYVGFYTGSFHMPFRGLWSFFVHLPQVLDFSSFDYSSVYNVSGNNT